MRVILGGTFDPVHIGHLRMATELASKLEVDHTYLMPCYLPVHKELNAPNQDDSTRHRLNMLRLALEGDPCLRLDEREIRRAVPSYTIDSLRELRHELGSTPLCLVMGVDAAHYFQEWNCVSEFSALTHIAVMQRPDWEEKTALLHFKRLGFEMVESVDQLRKSSVGKVLSVSLSALEISSSDIRASVAAQHSIRYLVTDAVREYICDNALYQNPL